MIDKASECVEGIIRNLGTPQGFSAAQSALQKLDLESISDDKRQKLINAIRAASTMRGGPLLVLSLPPSIHAEITLFSTHKVLGIDRTAFKRATPNQIVRCLTQGSANKVAHDAIIASYNFAAFKKEHWLEYFFRCSVPISAAKAFLAKSEKLGGFSDAEITQLVLRNPALVECIPVSRLGPNTVVALLISGRTSVLWQTYDFSRLNKNHWRELFLHTNPDKLPDASLPFIENKDGKGFSDDELLLMAQKCHALISSLNPNKVPFAIAYDLYLTGKADLLWKNFPFASLDKTEWRKILTNPKIRIPPFFLEVAKSNRFKIDELCELALKNERIHPFLVDLNVSPDLIINVLISTKADYIWDNYRFSQFSVENWERLIFGLKVGEILRPRAMASLKCCKGITEAFSSKVLSRNTSYAPNLPIATIAPDIAVDILLRGKGHFLWSTYPFVRLNDDQWLRLLGGTSEPIPQLGITFLKTRAGFVDNSRLEAVLFERGNLVEYVDAKYVSPRVAAMIFSRNAEHELWGRYDFSRFDSDTLRRVVKATKRNGNWPKSFVGCFKERGKPFDFGDLLEIATVKPGIVISLVSTEWVSSVDDDLFVKLGSVSARNEEGLSALRNRFQTSDNSWKDFSIEKLKRLLAVVPMLRFCTDWKAWPYRDISDLAEQNPVFEQEVARPWCYFIWKHFKSLFAMGALTAAALVAICLQNRALERKEAQRQHWNSIVHSIRNFDRNRSYGRMKEFWATVPFDDQEVVKNDLFVKKAFENLNVWEVDCKAIESGMSHLRGMSKTGWDSVAENAVEAVIGKLEKSHVDRYAENSEFQSLKHAHAEYRKQEAERARIKTLRAELADINARFSDCQDLAQLIEWNVALKSLVREEALKDEASNVLEKLTRQIDTVQARINAERIAQEVVAISNAVVSVSEELKKPTALKDFLACSAEYLMIKDMPGFDEYGKLPCHRDYMRLSEDFKVFEELKQRSANKLIEARRLDEKFSREFITEEGGMACSNVMSCCMASIKTANLHGWPSLSGANEMIRKLVEKILARDLRCWALVDKVNASSDYAGYLKARTELIKEFGHFDQFKHLGTLCDIEPNDLDRVYKLGSNSWWGQPKSYKYHFVGLISLHPESPSNVNVYVLPGSTTHSADLYTLMKSSSGSVSSIRLISQQGPTKFYKVSGVDYSNYQGAPLFVRSEHFAGKED